VTLPVPKPLRGIITPMVTPLIDRDLLDLPATTRLTEKLITAGVTGIFILGSTGEAAGLSYRLRAELIDHVCEVVGGRVPVLVGVTDTAVVETLNLGGHAAQAGASALVLAPPFYFALSQPELLGYLQRLAPELPLPVFLYNIPSLTKTQFTPETARAAADLPNVYGIKDSSGDMAYFAALTRALADCPEFTILCGPEEQLAEAMALGAHGGICGGSNLWPELYIDLYRAASSRDKPRVRRLHAIVMEISNGVYHSSEEGSSYLRGMKCALSLLDGCRNVMAEPYEPCSAAERDQIRGALTKVNLLPVPVVAGRARGETK
jgi:4-hydroxy-tetrahydrodipicolinate synthase